MPTWNFQTLQCRGKPEIVDQQGLMDILAKLTKFHEASFQKPWTMAKLDPEKRAIMVGRLMGFKIKIMDIKFKEKMSQIRDQEDRKNIMKELDRQNDTMSHKVSQIMREKFE